MKNRFLVFMLLWLSSFHLPAQDLELQRVQEGLGLFGDVKITKVRLLSETEEKLNLEVAYEVSNNKKYLMRGQVLNPRRAQLKEILSSAAEVSGRQGLADLSFDLKPNLDKSRYAEPYLQSGFIKILFTETKDGEDKSWGDLLGDLGGDNPLQDALSESVLYRLERKWRIGGGSSMVIQVPLTPVGRAGTMQKQ